MSLRDPYHHEVFVAVACPYWFMLNHQPFHGISIEANNSQDSVFEKGLKTDVLIL